MQKTLKYIRIIAIMLLVFPVITNLQTSSTVQLVNGQITTLPREETFYHHIDGGRISDVTQYNALSGESSDMLKAGLNQGVVESLFYYNLLNGTLYPWLGESIEMSPDFLTCTIKVRHGVKWNDGEDFTAHDVAFTINLLLQSHTPPLRSEGAVQLKIASVDLIDDYTVRLNLKKPDPRFLGSSLICPDWTVHLPIVPEHIYKDVEDVTTFKNPDCVYTGPYKIIDASPTGDWVVYERRDDYWGTKVLGIRPAAKYMVFVFYEAWDAIAQQMISNNLDMCPLLDAGTFRSMRQQNAYIRCWDLENPAFFENVPFILTVNCLKYPWNNYLVRQAISRYFDRDAINEISQGGVSPPHAGIVGPLIMPEFAALQIEKGEQRGALEYNPSKADAMLTSLGWSKGGDGVWVTENGTRVKAEVLVFGDFGSYMIYYGDQICDQLREAGFDVYEKTLVSAARTDAHNKGLWDFAATWQFGGPMGASAGDVWGPLEAMTSKYVVPVGNDSAANRARWSNATFDSIVDEMYGQWPYPDNPEYMRLFGEACDILFEQMPVISMIECADITPYNTYYWTNQPSRENPYEYPFTVYAGSGLQMMLHIIPRNIPVTTVYFTKDTTDFRPSGRFRGVDAVWYGPFESGDAARIPADDAEFWIRMGYASYTPPTPTIPTEMIEAIAAGVTNLQTSINSLSQKIEAMPDVASLTTLLYVTVGLQVVVLIAVIVVILRRK